MLKTNVRVRRPGPSASVIASAAARRASRSGSYSRAIAVSSDDLLAVERDAQGAELLLVEPRPGAETPDTLFSVTIFSSGSESRYGRNLRSDRRWCRQWSSAASASTASAIVVVDRGPLEREEEELGLERRRLLLQPRDERAARRVGHVRREDEVRVGQRPDDRGLDPLVLRDRLGERRGVELRDLPVVALAERGGVCLGLRRCRPRCAGRRVPRRDRRGPTRPLRRRSARSSPFGGIYRCTSSSGRVTGARHANRSQT